MTIFCLLCIEPNDADAYVRAADIHRQNGIVPRKYPRRRKMCCPDQSRLIGMVANGKQLDIDTLAFEKNAGASSVDMGYLLP